MNQALDDKSRFIGVLEFLPEKFVDDLICCYLYNAYYPTEMDRVISAYREYKRTILSEFSNVKINVSYAKLNESFDVLTEFLSKHFWIPDDHYEMYKNPPFFYLEPKIHHNFRFSEGSMEEGRERDFKEWNRYKKELDSCATNFEEAYRDFVKVSKQEIEQYNENKEVFKLSPEIYGVGINLKNLWKKIKFWFKR